MRSDDVKLIQRTLVGDEDAFANLVKKYQKQIHTYAWRKTKDFHIAEDITQETFLQVSQKLGTLQDPTQFKRWLYQIANRLCIAWFRKNQVYAESFSETHIWEIETGAYSRYVAAEHAKMTAETQRDLVENLLAKLNQKDRKVITLHYFENMTSSEISEFVGVSENTIKSRLRRARQRLKKYEFMIQEALDITIEGEHRFHKHLNGDFGMKLTFEKDDLLSSLQVLESVASQQDTAPILLNVLIQATESTIECMATDAEMGIRMKVDGTVKKAGSILVSAEKLADIVKTWPAEQPIDLATTKDDHIEITSGDSVRKIVGFSDKAFPQFPVVDPEAFAIDGEVLRSVLHKTAFAAPAEEDRRTFLNGLYFNLLEDRTEVVATDAVQLALTHCEPLKLSEDKDGFIVPLKAVKEIERTFANAPEIRISRIENQILFADADTTLTTQLIDAEYAPYESLIPESFEGHVVVPKASIMDTTREISARANPKDDKICLEINPQQIRISAKSSETDEIHETLAAESGTGSVRMGLNAQLLIETFSHIETESVSLEFTNALKPLVVKPIGEAGHICVLCTMLLDS
ncbi:DNA polymerase III subunit beta [Candidatus Poribacteria bacterium]|nr:DNA polymerase III subunit beta [Candidatus Poribacteria bacterium]MYH79569.1 DNA polymerase III subunit beta [Candidatus Poribacteria bacterium]MYK97194.1 DNA polymerase III subunit beta [Candidatus Poribacteria bacterium]